jgi:hypothetical protein
MRCGIAGCKADGRHEFRIALPADGGGNCLYAYPGISLCDAHRKTAAALEFFTVEGKQSILDSLARQNKAPCDFDRAKIEWRSGQ